MDGPRFRRLIPLDLTRRLCMRDHRLRTFNGSHCLAFPARTSDNASTDPRHQDRETSGLRRASNFHSSPEQEDFLPLRKDPPLATTSLFYKPRPSSRLRLRQLARQHDGLLARVSAPLELRLFVYLAVECRPICGPWRLGDLEREAAARPEGQWRGHIAAPMRGEERRADTAARSNQLHQPSASGPAARFLLPLPPREIAAATSSASTPQFLVARCRAE